MIGVVDRVQRPGHAIDATAESWTILQQAKRRRAAECDAFKRAWLIDGSL
jgi:hypothetical protein